MTKESASPSSLSRRQLLKGAVGAAALVSALPAGISAYNYAPPEASSPRVRETFDFGWKFFKGDAPGAQMSDFSESGWKNVDLPHDWSIEGPFDENAPSSYCGAYLPTGIGWYRKRFRVPEAIKDKLFTIEFGGVYQLSEVWINGHYLGKRPYGFVPFYYDLTPHLFYGRENLIAVRVDNSHQTNCRWYSGSGIYRHTWLLSTNKFHVAHWGTFVTTPKISKDAATVQVKTLVRNEGEHAVSCVLTTTIADDSGKPIQNSTPPQDVAANAEYEFTQQFRVDAPRLWSTADPHLYAAKSAVHVQDQLVDEYDTPFGIRDAVFDVDKGFLLNGERIKLNGACLHQEAGCVGSAVPERIWERRLQLLREMGCNAIRTSHNPYAAEFLDLCDRMGFLVMNEAFDEWKVPKGQIGPNGYSKYFDDWYRQDVQNFVRRDRNRPSVVIWSAGNEVGDQEAPQGAETLGELLHVFHTEDPTRPVTVGCDHIASDPPSSVAKPEFLALLDVVGYNYVDRWRDRREKYYSIDRHAFPQKRFVGTESEAMSGIRGDYRYLFPNEIPGGMLGVFLQMRRGHDIDVEEQWKFVSTYDYVSGDFMWTGIDYLGEARWPMKSASAGVIDTCGFKKDGFYFYQSQWTDQPVLHLFPHWNWKGREGQIIPVTCYTNCDTVELFLNGKSFGVKGYEFPRLGMEGHYGNYPARAKVLRTTADLHLAWDVPYEPGVLKAVGIKGAKVVSTVEVFTTGEPFAIAMSADRGVIAADRRDVASLTVQILDEKGRVVPIADNEVTFAVEGEASLIGVDNGDPSSHESYKASHRKAFNGLALAVIQSTAKPGAARVTATSPSLKSATVSLTTKA
ncbi:MAG TPA: glycoside hydrolase family 2 TIM barrel-domain containing protein [Candidatus Micrarchaeia archaeon]|nr:glycoside hydrolase family 2 TIM barrel-domain containing protein [Candidatus Micrarchaeia archaeon]